MVDIAQGKAACALSSRTIQLIVKCRTLSIEGNWHIDDSKSEGSDGIPSSSSYDYLINIEGMNNLVHPDDIENLEQNLNSRQSEKPLAWNLRVLTPAGDTKRLYGTGKVKEELQINNDHASIESIIENKNLLEAVFNTSSLGLHVLKSIRNEYGKIVDFDVILTNATSDRIAGKRVSGMRVLEGWPHTKEIGLFDKFVETVDTGFPLTYEHLYQGDGVSACFQWMASKFYDGLYVTIEDVTKRKKDEEALKYTADRLQSTFDGVPAIIALLDVVEDEQGQPFDFTISAANKALSDFTACRTQDLIGKSMTDLYPEAFRGKLRESYLKVFKTGEPLHLEYLYPGLDRWFSIFLTKQVDGKGIVAVALEITEQKKAEEQRKQNQVLAALNHAKTEFFSNISHEFRTPLTLMLGPLDETLKNVEGTSLSEHLAKLQMVKRNVLRLQKLVNSLLDFSRIEAGRTEAVFQPTDLAEFTTLLAGNFRSAIENAGLEFRVNCQSGEPVYVNQDMWEKIVLNLLSNAFKFTFKGYIEVTLKSQKKRIKLRVRDSGVGIADSDRERIFERFERVKNTKCRTFEGSGIGLSLVKELVNIHGGNIKVNSRPGQGAEFIVLIPKGKSHLPAGNVHEIKDKLGVSPLSAIYGYEAMTWLPENGDGGETIGSTKVGHNGSYSRSTSKAKGTILLVDDNSDMREYIRTILSPHYVVVTAHDGMKAIEYMSAGLVPDLILADIMMPEMDGYSLLEAINADEKHMGTPFVFLSSKASEEERVKGICHGADDYLIKPFSSVELLARVGARMKK